MKPQNVLLLAVDEQSTKVLGCHGNPLVHTPNVDRLALQGTRFSSAYTTSPICVPARATMATGRYPHETGTWDNCHPYTGQVQSWAHRLREAGHRVVSIGKLHYRNASDDTGFSEQILPMHVASQGGDLRSLLRSPLPGGKRRSKLVEQLGPGGSAKTRYDSEVTRRACEWLAQAAGRDGKPWALFVSQVSPHPPWSPPAAFYDLYQPQQFTLPKPASAALHPAVQAFRDTRNDDDFMDDATRIRALHSYYAMCSFADNNVGLILAALDAAGLRESTRIIYTSDHGDNLGARGLWSKCVMYEESAAVPMILSGPDVPEEKICNTPVSLLDLYPTLLEGAGLTDGEASLGDRGRSLWQIARAPDDKQRVMFAEYHAVGSPCASFMLRRGRYKLIYYVGFAPELFDLEADPEELNDLSAVPACQPIRKRLELELRDICDPEALDSRAKAQQQATMEAHGGRAVVEQMGWLQGTPVPGEAVDAWH